SAGILARRITHLSQAANTSVIAQTIEQVPANQSQRWDISFRGLPQGQTGTSALNFSWGSNTYRMVLPSNAHPRIERRVTDAAFNSGVPSWAPWKVLNKVPVVRMHGPGKMENLTIRIRCIAGFLVLDFDTGGSVTKVWVADVYYPPAPPGTPNKPD